MSPSITPRVRTKRPIAERRAEKLKTFGAYVVLDELGKGGMGQVYKARHPLMERIVAIKTVIASAFKNEEAIRRFENEIKALARINHPNVVAAQFAERLPDGSYYLVMDYVEGADLFTLVRGDGKNPPKTMNWRTACNYTAQAARGLAEAHKLGIIHRDVKPNNLVLSKDGVVKVLDLGLARFVNSGDSMTPTGSPMGTPEYMAPEQWADAKRVGPATDIYALGGVLYYLIAGRHVFGHKTALPEKLWAHLHEPPPQLRAAQSSAPEELEALFQKMMAKKPEDRYRSMAEVAAVLDAIVKPKAGLPSASLPSPASSSSSALPRPNPTTGRWIAIGCAGFAIAASAIAIWARGWDFGGQVEKPTTSTNPQPPTPQPPPKPQPIPFPSPFAGEIGIKMVRLEAGEFLMGSSDEDAKRDERDFVYLAGATESEKPQHNEVIARPFWMAAHEITVGQFRRFADEENYQTDAETDGHGGFGLDEQGNFLQAPRFTWRSPGFDQTDDHPVVNVSRNDAVKFCEWLSKKSGRKFELPTEPEWEYACRAGSTSRYFFGDDPEGLAKVGNVADAALKKTRPDWTTIAADDGYVCTAPVGRFLANSWGLHDMHGNASEWCRDVYNSNYVKPEPQPREPGELVLIVDANYVIRGGSWSLELGYLRSADRAGRLGAHRHNNLGFRVVAY